MNKSCRALVTRYYAPPYQNLKQVNHPYLFQVNPPFYPSFLLICYDDIKYWFIVTHFSCRSSGEIVQLIAHSLRNLEVLGQVPYTGPYKILLFYFTMISHLCLVFILLQTLRVCFFQTEVNWTSFMLFMIIFAHP